MPYAVDVHLENTVNKIVWARVCAAGETKSAVPVALGALGGRRTATEGCMNKTAPAIQPASTVRQINPHEDRAADVCEDTLGQQTTPLTIPAVQS